MSEFTDETLAQARLADGKPMSDKRLSEVFDLVKPDSNWKGPIAAIFPKEKATKAEIKTAVTWYAGGVPEVEDLGTKWYVTGAGYYVWIGA